MKNIAFCSRCRGMKVGLNKNFIKHCLNCRQYLAIASKLFILGILLSVFIFSFPKTVGLVQSDMPEETVFASVQVGNASTTPIPRAVSAPIEAILNRFKVAATYRD